MTREGPVRNRPTELVGRHMRLTREAQILLVAEAMAQVRPLDEVARTGVLGGVEAYVSPSQKAWYDEEQARVLKAARKAAKAQAAAGPVEVLAPPVRFEQIEQRHYARAERQEPEMPVPAALFSLIATPTYWLIRNVRAGGYDEEVRTLRPHECGGTLTVCSSHGQDQYGGSSLNSVSCDRCGFSDADGDSWSRDEDGMGGYEEACDAAFHRANPDAHWQDALCHRCQEHRAQDGTMLCRECEVDLHGEFGANDRAEGRRLRALPYRPVMVQDGLYQQEEQQQQSAVAVAEAGEEQSWEERLAQAPRYNPRALEPGDSAHQIFIDCRVMYSGETVDWAGHVVLPPVYGWDLELVATAAFLVAQEEGLPVQLMALCAFYVYDEDTEEWVHFQ